jgi:hypothetical protein
MRTRAMVQISSLAKVSTHSRLDTFLSCNAQCGDCSSELPDCCIVTSLDDETIPERWIETACEFECRLVPKDAEIVVL